jgi:hypothetical protein
MSVYVDELRDYGWRLGPSCHLIADTEDELHAFAARVGMKRSWFQNKSLAPHYDLVASRRAAAVRLGAIELERRAFVNVMRRITGRPPLEPLVPIAFENEQEEP